MIPARRVRFLAIVLAGVVSAPLLPAPATGRPAPAVDCASLASPQALTSLDAGDLFLFAVACPGLVVRAKAKESRREVEAPGVAEEEHTSKLRATVRPAPAGHPAPPAVLDPDPVQVALDRGYEIDQENTVEIESRPGYRSERRQEETDIDGDGFSYRSEETSQETERHGSSTRSRQSEERFDSR